MQARRASAVAAAVVALAAGVWLVRGCPPSPAPTKGTRAPERPAALSAVAVPSVPPPIDVSAAPRPVAAAPAAQFAWGGRLGELGRSRPEEANPEMPMAVAPLPGGGLVVLDQVNGRLVKTDAAGRPTATLPMKVRAPQDVAVGPDGTLAVLDRLGDQAVEILGPDGRSRGLLPLAGKGIPEGGATTGVFIDGATKTVFVEVEHGALWPVGGTDGTPSGDARTSIAGRPSRDGTAYLSAGITDAAAGRLWASAMERSSGTQRWTRELRMGRAARTILALDSDRAGGVYLAVELPETDGTTSLRALCLSGKDGHLLGVVALPASAMPEESVRDFAILDDGTIVHAEPTEDGIRYVSYRCP